MKKKLPVIRLNVCILPHCDRYINLHSHEKEINYAVDNNIHLIIAYNDNPYGVLFFPDSKDTNVHINALTKVYIKNNKISGNMEKADYDKCPYNVTQACMSYKASILDILESIYNAHIQKKITINNIFTFVGENNFLQNLKLYSVEKFAFFVYNYFFTEEYDRYYAITIPNLERIYQLCFNKVKELSFENITNNVINQKIQEKIQDYQKKLYLQEKLTFLQEEMEQDDDISQLESKANTLPDEIKKITLKEINRLKKVPNISSEGSVIRSYIEWILSIPFNTKLTPNRDMSNIINTINNSHYGMDQVKKKVECILAAMNKSNKMKHHPILLVGPPGVGKTSFVKAIGEALKLPVEMISLAGVSDATLLIGSARSYLGAIPGKFIQALKRLGCMNGILHLDELDKMGKDPQRPALNVLISFLDQAQNDNFQDSYMGFGVDFSETLCILTCNSTEWIPAPILNRMQIIYINGYDIEEKMHILPLILDKKMQELNINGNEIKIEKSIYKEIIENYTMESGVRQLGLVLTELLQFAILYLYKNNKTSVTINKTNLHHFIDKEKFSKDMIHNIPGCCTGLAWTALGGVLCPIECKIIQPAVKELVLTGSLGKVMEESVKIALSCIKEKCNITNDNCYIHIHAPEGAVSKDGPSAGITIFSALYSEINKFTIPNDLAMTGELTLSGKVLKIGGLKEKLSAAVRYDIKKVIIPKENSIRDIPSHITDKIEILKVGHINEVISILETHKSVISSSL